MCGDSGSLFVYVSKRIRGQGTLSAADHNAVEVTMHQRKVVNHSIKLLTKFRCGAYIAFIVTVFLSDW